MTVHCHGMDWLIKVCLLEMFQRSLVGSHWIGLASQKWGSQSGSREAGRQRADVARRSDVVQWHVPRYPVPDRSLQD